MLHAWLSTRQIAALTWQALAWRQAWRAAGGSWRIPGLHHGDEVAGMEVFLTLEAEVKAAAAVGVSADATAEELQSVFRKLSQDLQAALLMTPGRAELLKTEN